MFAPDRNSPVHVQAVSGLLRIYPDLSTLWDE